MNFRERLLTALAGGQPDIMPWFADLSYWYGAQQHFGTLRGIMPLLGKSGLDYIEAVTPKPTGDVAVEDLRDLAGPDVILFGGIPGAMFAPPFTAEDMRRQVELVIAHHWDYGKFIMGVADQVPPNGDLNLVRLAGDLVEELCR